MATFLSTLRQVLQAHRREQAAEGDPGQAHHHDYRRGGDVPLHPGQDLGEHRPGV